MPDPCPAKKHRPAVLYHSKETSGKKPVYVVHLQCKVCGTRWEDRNIKGSARKVLSRSFHSGRVGNQAPSKFYNTFKPNGVWKIKGYDLMEAAEAWAPEHRGAYALRIDDENFTSGTLMVLEDRSKSDWFGALCVVLTQYDTEPVSFWIRSVSSKWVSMINSLHRHHAKGLLESLSKAEKDAVAFRKVYKAPQPP